ncbi:MAG: hypothetical protein ACYSX0_12370 [Planctomycetota bacterium]
MTTGRTGSTSLMKALQAHSDILVPNRQVDCVDNELVHPDYMDRYVGYYARACSRPVAGEAALIDAFFETASGFAFAGFKSMPDRHADIDAFIGRTDIRFIVLERLDIASTIASFITAIDEGCWRREGGPQPHRWHFDPEHHERIRGHLKYLTACFACMDRIPDAIRLTYEEICEPGFSNRELDEFFERSIAIPDPQPPLSGEDYVKNWDEFRSFVMGELDAAGERTAS